MAPQRFGASREQAAQFGLQRHVNRAAGIDRQAARELDGSAGSACIVAQREGAATSKMEPVIGVKSWPFAALRATLRRLLQQPAKHNPRIAASDVAHWPTTLYDVLGDPVLIARSPDGTEVAWSYARYPALPEVPPHWVRAHGVEIDAPRFDGMTLAKHTERTAPSVFIGADGGAVIITPKGTLTRLAGATPRWRRGIHIPVAQFRRMRHAIGELARMTMADSQDPAAWRTAEQQTDVEILKAVAALHGPLLQLDHTDLDTAPEARDAARLASEAIARAAG